MANGWIPGLRDKIHLDSVKNWFYNVLWWEKISLSGQLYKYFFFNRSTIAKKEVKSAILCIILDDSSQEKTFNDTESSHENFQTILPEESKVDAETTSENSVIENTSTTSVND